MDQGLRKVEVLLRGQGSGRETSVRALEVLGLDIFNKRYYSGTS
jgi:small subunit ribosomal protein S11